MPLALLPVIAGDLDSVRLLSRRGVHYAALDFNGTSALEVARRLGIPGMLQAMRVTGRDT